MHTRDTGPLGDRSAGPQGRPARRVVDRHDASEERGLELSAISLYLGSGLERVPTAKREQRMALELVLTKGKSAGLVVPIKREKLFIGRAPDCHLRLRNKHVSRHHCALLQRENALLVRDFGSSNGTYVNGERVERQRTLEPGDRVSVGPLEFEVREGASVAKEQKPDDDAFTVAEQEGAETRVDDDTDITAFWAAMGPLTKERPKATWQTIQDTQQDPSEEEEEEAEEDGPIDTSEHDKERMRRHEKIVGVSEATQARRTAETTRDAAADLLRKLFR